MTKALPDCTGLRYGLLTVLGKGGRRSHKKSYCQLWKMQCDCGKVIEIPRHYFENCRQVSCGCKRKRGLVDNKRRPLNIKGQRFGQLVAIKLTGKKDNGQKPTWLLQCDCGLVIEFSLSRIRQLEHGDTRINCGSRINHPDRWLTYPPTPKPYPRDAGELLIKYLPLTELRYQKIDSEIEDEKRDRLFRAAWIITYRRSRGEIISELYESRIIKKHLRYCSIDVFWRRKLKESGGLIIDRCYNKRELKIGNAVTNITPQNYPVIETQEKNILFAKKIRFRRC